MPGSRNLKTSKSLSSFFWFFLVYQLYSSRPASSDNMTMALDTCRDTFSPLLTREKPVSSTPALIRKTKKGAGHFGGVLVVRVIACHDWLNLDHVGFLWPLGYERRF